MKHSKINKLNVVTDYMPSAETVSVKVMVKTGSRDEVESNGGISHFLEHMAFKGTKSRSAKQIAEEFDMIGGHFNAYTSREKTVYYAKVIKKEIEKAVDILADIMQNSVFAEDEINRERGVILEELAQTKDTPEEQVFDMFQDKMFPNQPIGRPILGSESFIKHVSRQDLIDYVNEHYKYDNITISCAGNFQEANFSKMIEQKFTNFVKGEVITPVKALYVGGEQRLEKDLEQVHITIGFPGLSYMNDSFYTQQILSIILGGGMSSRLFQEIRERRGLAYHISAFSVSYSDLGAFSIYSSTNHGSVNELITATAEQFKIALDDIRAVSYTHLTLPTILLV